MTQQSTTPVSEAHCLTTNDHYRTTILNVCQTCINKAETQKEFLTMMETIELVTNALSDYPKTDENFIHGAVLALISIKRWNQ